MLHRPARTLRGCGLLLTLLVGGARAAETDQLSGRRYEAPDVSVPLDAYVNARLEEARARAERRMRPGWTDQQVADELRRQLYREFRYDVRHFGAPIETWMTHELAPLGYGLETLGPGTGWHDNIYDRYRAAFRMPWRDDFPMASIVFFGSDLFMDTLVAPTFITNDVRYGSDKWSHFFRLGYRYYTRSEHGANPAAALAYGMETEKGGVGYRTSGAVSFADLAANYSGYRFNAELMAGERPYFIRQGERLVQVRPFRSADWVEESWDEYLNPNLYRPHTLAVIRLHLEENRARVCEDYRVWRDTRGGPRAPLRPLQDYVDLENAPERVDPWELDALCAGEVEVQGARAE